MNKRFRGSLVVTGALAAVLLSAIPAHAGPGGCAVKGTVTISPKGHLIFGGSAGLSGGFGVDGTATEPLELSPLAVCSAGTGTNFTANGTFTSVAPAVTGVDVGSFTAGTCSGGSNGRPGLAVGTVAVLLLDGDAGSPCGTGIGVGLATFAPVATGFEQCTTGTNDDICLTRVGIVGALVMTDVPYPI